MLSRERWGPAAQVEFKECIVVNWVTPLSLTFNLVTVSFPQAKSCLFKWRPAQHPLPWRSAVRLHWIFHKWADGENLFLLFPLQDETSFRSHSYTSAVWQDWMQPGIMNLQKHLLVQGAVISGSLPVPQDRTECHPSGVEQMCRVSPGV